MTQIIPLDTRHGGQAGSIASFLVPYSGGAVLVDVGPGSTVAALTAALAERGLTPERITDVLLTHIHLDHAGAAGWFAGKGARIHVHPVGAPHLLNPEKLLASSRRVYGDGMDELWGEFLPVPAARLVEVQDETEIRIGALRFSALHTPGHAEHHVAYFLENTCFTGDVGGVRRAGPFYVRLPFVPPETHLGKWRESLVRIQTQNPSRLALVHFGIYDDVKAHLAYASRSLDEVENWLEKVMPEISDVETLKERYIAWMYQIGRAEGLDEETLTGYDFSSPASMGAGGLFRYWQKVRMAG